MIPLKRPRRSVLRFRNPIAFLVLLAIAVSCSAQTQTNLPNAPEPQPDVTVKGFRCNVLKDQKAIWTSPAHIRVKDLDWLVPLAAVTGFGHCHRPRRHASRSAHDAKLNKRSLDASNVLTGGMIAAPVGLFGWGAIKNSPHAREAGLLGAEAMVDGVVVEQGMKLIFWRERPRSRQREWQVLSRAARVLMARFRLRTA